MKFKKPNDLQIKFLEKYTVIGFVTASLLFLIGLFLIPINPSDYLFPLAGVFHNHGNILLCIYGIFYGLAQCRFKKYFTNRYNSKIVPGISISLVILIFIFSILSAFPFMPLSTSVRILIYLSAGLSVLTIDTCVLTNKDKSQNMQLTEMLINKIPIYVGSLLIISITFVLSIDQLNSILILIAAIILLFYSIYLFVILSIVEVNKKKKLKGISKDDLEQVRTEIKEQKDQITEALNQINADNK